jgi:hypothetical protein
LLVYLKITREDLFHQIDKGELSIQGLSDLISDLMLSEGIEIDRVDMAYVEALLLWLYNNNGVNRKKLALLDRDAQGRPTTPVISKLGSENDKLARYFEHIDRQRYDHIKLEFLLNKINLTELVRTQ